MPNDTAQRPPVADVVRAVVRPEIRELAAYAVAKVPGGAIKLDAMENPYPLPPALRERIAAALAQVGVNRYPDGSGDAVKQALRAALPVPAGAGIALGNGSDELIQMLTALVARPGACVLAPEPSFVMYRLIALHANVRYVGVPLAPNFSLDVPAMLAAVERERPSIVWLAYPNNPTGNRFPRADVERVIAAARLVVVDEAYSAFAEDSFLPRALDHPNVVVVRTLSKVGLAGVRLGYAVAHPDWIDEIDKVRPPYNVNAYTQAAVPLVLAESAELDRQARAIRAERARLSAALAGLPGVTVFPSETNFVLARVPDAGGAWRALRDAGILVKNLDGSNPLVAGCLRITVGNPAENDALIEALTARIA